MGSNLNESSGPGKAGFDGSASKKNFGSSRLLEDQSSVIKRRSNQSDDGRLQDELDN